MYIIIFRYFDSNPDIPMYSTEAPSFGADEAVKLLFNAEDDVICSKQPIGCKKSATFIINVSNLGYYDDVRADDLGIWNNKRVRTNHFHISFRGSGKVKHLENLGNTTACTEESILIFIETYLLVAQ